MKLFSFDLTMRNPVYVVAENMTKALEKLATKFETMPVRCTFLADDIESQESLDNLIL